MYWILIITLVLELNEDQKMEYLDPKVYGSGVPWEEDGKGGYYLCGIPAFMQFGLNCCSGKKTSVPKGKLKTSAHFVVYAQVLFIIKLGY